MTHVLIDCNLGHAEWSARKFGLTHMTPTVWAQPDGMSVLLRSNVERSASALRAEDTLYLGERYIFAYGDILGLIRDHEARGGTVKKLSDLS